MSPDALQPSIEQIVALYHHSVVLAQAWQHVKSSVISQDSAYLQKLGQKRLYARQVGFLLRLPHSNPVDRDLIGMAIIHVEQTLEALQFWDGGKQIRATYSCRCQALIHDQLSTQDIHTWARQAVYNMTSEVGVKHRHIHNKIQLLNDQAEKNLDLILRHVVNVSDR